MRKRAETFSTLLSVVLALALTMALAACGSDEPSGGTGPDRTASTPTAPPAASGSAETDREALVALYNANGENWYRKRQLAERRAPRRMVRASSPTTTGALQS